MKVIKHISITFGMLLILLGIPLAVICKGMAFNIGTDAISSATVIIEQPTGAYVVLINRDLHKNEKNLKTWEKFFRGEEIDFLFEDISCMTGDIDSEGTKQAESFQSRLPENQMKVRREDITLMLSKIAEGYFDVAVISAEISDAYHVEDIVYDNTEIINGERF